MWKGEEGRRMGKGKKKAKGNVNGQGGEGWRRENMR